MNPYYIKSENIIKIKTKNVVTKNKVIGHKIKVVNMLQ